MPAPSVFQRALFSGGGHVNVVSFIVAGAEAVEAHALGAVLGRAGAMLPAGISVAARDVDDGEFAQLVHDLIESTDAPDPDSLLRSPAWIEFAGDTPDAADHAALLAAWGAVQLLVAEIAPRGAVFDGMSFEWHRAPDVLACPPGSLRLAASWRCEAEAIVVGPSGEQALCVHTLGLAKFARRDLVLFGDVGARAALFALVEGFGHDLVAGAVLRPGDMVEKARMRVEVEEYRPGENGPAVEVPFFVPPLVLLPVR